MIWQIGERWAVRRPNQTQDFDFVIVGKGSKPDRKLCRVEYVYPNATTRVNFEQEYTHKHIKECSVLVYPGMTEDEIRKKAAQFDADNKAFELLMEVVQLSRSEKPYKHLLPELKKALKFSPKAADMCTSMIANLEGIRGS